MSTWRAVPGGVEIGLRVQPRARRAAIEGPTADGARLRIAVTEPPEDGRANEAVCRAIAKALGVAPSRVVLIRGGTAREKTVRVEGDATALEAALSGLP